MLGKGFLHQKSLNFTKCSTFALLTLGLSSKIFLVD